MKKHSYRTLALAFTLAAASFALPGSSSASDTGWEKLRTEEGIVVSRKEVEGSPFVAFRGEGDVDAPLLLSASVLVDIARDHEWVDSVVEARILHPVSATEYVTYSHVGTPAGMSDRDFVMSVTLTVEPAQKKIVVRMRSIDDPMAPKTSYVRGQLKDSSFTLSASPDGKKTHVVAEIHCDPMGSVPSFMVNFFQNNWGYNTVSKLRKQVARKDVGNNPKLQALLAERGLSL
jgi:hypothetical protein